MKLNVHQTTVFSVHIITYPLWQRVGYGRKGVGYEAVLKSCFRHEVRKFVVVFDAKRGWIWSFQSRIACNYFCWRRRRRCRDNEYTPIHRNHPKLSNRMVIIRKSELFVCSLFIYSYFHNQPSLLSQQTPIRGPNRTSKQLHNLPLFGHNQPFVTHVR